MSDPKPLPGIMSMSILRRSPSVLPVIGCIALGSAAAIGYTLGLTNKKPLPVDNKEKKERKFKQVDPKTIDMIVAQERRQATLEHTLSTLREELRDVKQRPITIPDDRQISNVNVFELSKVIEANDLAAERRHKSELDEQKQSLLREYMIRVEGEVSKVENKYHSIALRLKEVESIMEKQKKIQELEAPARILWISCQSLLDRILSNPQEPLENDPAFEALRRFAADNDPLAISILDSIPSRILKSGVHSQTSLVSRFSKVDKICRRVAMVDETGGGVTRYLISYLQSLFIINNVTVLEDEVTGRKLVDPSSWLTHDILARVKYCLHTQNLEQAIRYANQLRGQARFVARDWIRDARAHLEIRQALSVMSTHAKAIAVDAVDQQLVE